ncbi:MAG: cytochrome b N-terminal domain-containing protein [Phycisphaerales bacterium]|nr:MAG: cytochrome b N-terminal domain-containing protein [Phycisphaerales bacterium]
MTQAQSSSPSSKRRVGLLPLIKLHLPPRLVPRSLGWAGCLGGLAFVQFLIQAYTGILLLIYYKPDPARAWDSVTFIKSNVPMGWLIQRVHTVGADMLIVLVFMHMARVAYYKIYRPPREFHWVSGMVLLGLTTFMAFTGYLLPWSNLSYWAASVGTEIPSAVPGIGEQIAIWLRRGQNISAETLGFFFAMHVAVLPALIVCLMGVHFIMIRRTGIAKPL